MKNLRLMLKQMSLNSSVNQSAIELQQKLVGNGKTNMSAVSKSTAFYHIKWIVNKHEPNESQLVSFEI